MTLKDDFVEVVVKSRRLKILRLLSQAPPYTLDEVELRDMLQTVSVAVIREDLKHLRDRDCLVLDTSAGVWIAQLTRTGRDVGLGLTQVEGVAVPGPTA